MGFSYGKYLGQIMGCVAVLLPSYATVPDMHEFPLDVCIHIA